MAQRPRQLLEVLESGSVPRPFALHPALVTMATHREVPLQVNQSLQLVTIARGSVAASHLVKSHVNRNLDTLASAGDPDPLVLWNLGPLSHYLQCRGDPSGPS